MPFNYSKLKGRIIEKYGSMTNFSEELGVSKQALSRKINGNIGISRTDILKWCELLDIEQSEIGIYFFA